VIPVDGAGMNDDVVRTRGLAQQLATPLPNIPRSTGYRYFVTKTRWYLQSQTGMAPRL